ncbi:hypothetical protein AVEN_203595-1 [Araneus ventricosus]|uniref:Uncharacterized protein n=1 Tax=Araneus ventricosus TaxID=182803 RepID=A0A4Y2JZF4_ARAVE|nr:hypothetical protein AVEN_203595-1 [Araneus ventricosus]
MFQSALSSLRPPPVLFLPAKLTHTHPSPNGEGAPSPPRPGFSSLTATPTHFPFPNAPPTGVIYRPPRRIIFHFYGHPFQWKTNLVGIPISQYVYANFHRDFTLTNGFGILCSKKYGVEQR